MTGTASPVTLTMTLSKDLAEDMAGAVEQVPTPMGADLVVAIVSALGPSITIATTSLFSSEAFRRALSRWCKRSQGGITIDLRTPSCKISLDLDEETAPRMAQEVADIITEFVAIHPTDNASSTSEGP